MSNITRNQITIFGRKELQIVIINFIFILILDEFYNIKLVAYDDFLTTKFVNNIEYLGTGYNIAYANPRSSEGIDPGYRYSKIFTN